MPHQESQTATAFQFGPVGHRVRLRDGLRKRHHHVLGLAVHRIEFLPQPFLNPAYQDSERQATLQVFRGVFSCIFRKRHHHILGLAVHRIEFLRDAERVGQARVVRIGRECQIGAVAHLAQHVAHLRRIVVGDGLVLPVAVGARHRRAGQGQKDGRLVNRLRLDAHDLDVFFVLTRGRIPVFSGHGRRFHAGAGIRTIGTGVRPVGPGTRAVFNRLAAFQGHIARMETVGRTALPVTVGHCLQFAAREDAGRVGRHQRLQSRQRLRLQLYQIVARPFANAVILNMFFHNRLFFICL